MDTDTPYRRREAKRFKGSCVARVNEKRHTCAEVKLGFQLLCWECKGTGKKNPSRWPRELNEIAPTSSDHRQDSGPLLSVTNRRRRGKPRASQTEGDSPFGRKNPTIQTNIPIIRDLHPCKKKVPDEKEHPPSMLTVKRRFLVEKIHPYGRNAGKIVDGKGRSDWFQKRKPTITCVPTGLIRRE